MRYRMLAGVRGRVEVMKGWTVGRSGRCRTDKVISGPRQVISRKMNGGNDGRKGEKASAWWLKIKTRNGEE